MCHFTIIQARIIMSWQLSIPNIYQRYSVSGSYAAFLLMDYTDTNGSNINKRNFTLLTEPQKSQITQRHVQGMLRIITVIRMIYECTNKCQRR